MCSLLLLFSEMLVHRRFPALEEFSLVVCHVCNQVVTPQGVLEHYGRINPPRTPHSTGTHSGNKRRRSREAPGVARVRLVGPIYLL